MKTGGFIDNAKVQISDPGAVAEAALAIRRAICIGGLSTPEHALCPALMQWHSSTNVILWGGQILLIEAGNQESERHHRVMMTRASFRSRRGLLSQPKHSCSCTVGPPELLKNHLPDCQNSACGVKRRRRSTYTACMYNKEIQKSNQRIPTSMDYDAAPTTGSASPRDET